MSLGGPRKVVASLDETDVARCTGGGLQNGVPGGVKAYKKRYKSIITVGTNNEENIPRGESPRAWFHIVYVRRDTPVENVRDHLKNLLKHENFTCEQIKTFTTRHNSYRVGVDPSDREALTDAANWGRGVRVSKYIFRKEAHRHAT